VTVQGGRATGCAHACSKAQWQRPGVEATRRRLSVMDRGRGCGQGGHAACVGLPVHAV
jgi:hypothetical protein